MAVKKEIIHWVWNHGEDPISILLLGTQDVHSPLSLLRGLESIVLKIVMDWTVLPCNCCRDGPVAFCCIQQQKLLMDKDKESVQNFPWRLGEVPDALFVQGNVCWYEEGLRAGRSCGGYVAAGGSGSATGPSPPHRTYLAVTDTAFHYGYGDKKLCFDWNKSANVIITIEEEPSELCVELVEDRRNPYDDDLYNYSCWNFTTPRFQEIFDLIQAMRRTVLTSSKYKETLKLVYGDDPPKGLYG